jgi:hypothetical protein
MASGRDIAIYIPTCLYAKTEEAAAKEKIDRICLSELRLRRHFASERLCRPVSIETEVNSTTKHETFKPHHEKENQQ